MYCPGCGSEERQKNQYCRACGTDLRRVRFSLEAPDSITASAVTAREEIGRAVAEKIREVEGTRDLKRVAEDVLPQIEKFLESPAEKRLRRMRAGVITAAVGLGSSVTALLLLSVFNFLNDPQAIPQLMGLAGLGVITFLIGMGLILNGRLLTQPEKAVKGSSADAETQNQLDSGPPQLRPGEERPDLFRSPATNDLMNAELRAPSVTEHTTKHLKT